MACAQPLGPPAGPWQACDVELDPVRPGSSEPPMECAREDLPVSVAVWVELVPLAANPEQIAIDAACFVSAVSHDGCETEIVLCCSDDGGDLSVHLTVESNPMLPTDLTPGAEVRLEYRLSAGIEAPAATSVVVRQADEIALASLLLQDSQDGIKAYDFVELLSDRFHGQFSLVEPLCTVPEAGFVRRGVRFGPGPDAPVVWDRSWDEGAGGRAVVERNTESDVSQFTTFGYTRASS